MGKTNNPTRHPELTYWGLPLAPPISLSRVDSRALIIREVHAQARKSFTRTLGLEQRIQYVNMCLLAKIWFTAQILLPTRMHVQQLISTCRWYIWQTSIFRVPITTLQRPKHEGGWDLPNIELKCKTLSTTASRSLALLTER